MKKAWLIAVGLVVAVPTVGQLITTKPSEEDIVAGAKTERRMIEDRCYKFAINISGTYQYGSQSGAAMEGCKASYLERSLYEENRKEGNRLIQIIQPANSQHSSEFYFYHLTRHLNN